MKTTARVRRELRLTGIVGVLVAGCAAVPLAAQELAGAARRLTLAEVVALAGAAPAVQLAELRQDEAEARIGQARAVLLPSLSATSTAVNRTFNSKSLGISIPTPPGVQGLPALIGPFDNYDARLKVTQTLLDPSSWLRVRAARTAMQVSESERAAAVEASAQAAALAYLRAARAQAVVQARQADADIAAELLAVAEAQEKAGTSPHIDVLRARAQLVAARGQGVVAQNLLDRSRIDLARALGLDPSTRIEIADSLSASIATAAVPEESAAALTLALQRRPELRAETLRRARGAADRAALAAQRLPRLDASVDYGLNGETVAKSIATRQIVVGLSVPILDGLRREALISEQNSVIRAAEVRERDLRDQIAADIDAAFLDLASGQELQAMARERLQLALEELVQARDRFANGVANNIEVITAQSALLRARDSEIEARFASGAARIGLARAVGVAQTIR